MTNKTERMSVADYKAGKVKPNKYSARTVHEDGHLFASKLERDRYVYWKNLWQIGAICWFTRQVPFYLPGGIIWRCDFLVVHKMWTEKGYLKDKEPVMVEDCKGVMTRVSLNKIKQVEAIYGFKVEIIKRGWKR